MNDADLDDGTNPEDGSTIQDRLYATTDAMVWAKEFMGVVMTHVTGSREEATLLEFLDEGLMVGWFANAMEIALTHQRAQEGSLRKIIEAHGYEVIDGDFTYRDGTHSPVLIAPYDAARICRSLSTLLEKT